MMKRACIARQQQAHENIDETGRHVRDLPMSFEKCIDCEQGRKIMEENQSTVGANLVFARNADPETDAGTENTEPATRNAQTETRPALRTCKKCGEEKPETEFYRTSGGGLDWACKACKKKRRAENKRLKKARVGVGPRAYPKKPGPTDIVQKGSDGRSQGSPLQRQVGGDHYKTFVIQPIEFITRNGLTFTQGNVVKRICRYNKPGGKGHEDLHKIIHELELLMELEA
jgi:hypothetical protein